MNRPKRKLPPGTRKVGYLLDDETVAALRRLADLEDRSQSSMLRQLIRHAAMASGVWDRHTDETTPQDGLQRPV